MIGPTCNRPRVIIFANDHSPSEHPGPISNQVDTQLSPLPPMTWCGLVSCGETHGDAPLNTGPRQRPDASLGFRRLYSIRTICGVQAKATSVVPPRTLARPDRPARGNLLSPISVPMPGCGCPNSRSHRRIHGNAARLNGVSVTSINSPLALKIKRTSQSPLDFFIFPSIHSSQ